MDTIVLKYDACNPIANKTLDYILSLGIFEKIKHKDSSFVDNTAPEGYMTGEDFRKRAIVKVNTFCDEHGIL
jgi:hypothetical protein